MQAHMLTVQLGGCAQMGQSKIRVYGLGQWFIPCVWNDEACHKAMAAEVGCLFPSAQTPAHAKRQP